MPTLQEHFHFRIKFVDVKLRFTHFCKSMCILVLVTVSVWMGLRWLCRCKRLHWERRLICNPYHHNKPKHTPTHTCKLFKAPDGNRRPGCQRGKEFIHSGMLSSLLSVKINETNAFYLGKADHWIPPTGVWVHPCVHQCPFNAFPLFSVSWLQTLHRSARVCVCVCVKQQHWSV